MVENQLLRHGWLDCEVILRALELWRDGRAPDRVLEEGFTTTDPRAFLDQLLTRMARLNRIHSQLSGLETTADALLDFIHVSRRESKLTLARYLLTPAETAARILDCVEETSGLEKELAPRNMEKEEMASEPGDRISPFDRELAGILRRNHRVLWVSGRTSSEVNSLVEYPLTTVALAIKPPGSDVEFEVKRAGMRGASPLDVLFERDGKQVPPFHRLQGASCGFMLDFESWASLRFREIYHSAHGVQPPMSRFLGITAISTVARRPNGVHLMEYFSYPWSFGPGFERMQSILRQCVEAFEGDEPRNDLEGPIGWTVRFLAKTVPNQAWLAETSSFRLDRTADLLSERGPEIYFREGLKRDYTARDARRLADELLEEVLGVFCPAQTGPDTYAQYIAASLAREPNRSRADAAYLGCLRDIGRYWGTLLAVGGYTEGESFVTRNVGLKNRWRQARWETRICFMDHDCLQARGIDGDWPNPSFSIEGMRKDHDWIRGKHCDRSEFACLREIYRVAADCEKAGEAQFLDSVAKGYRVTRDAMKSSALEKFFDAEFVRGLELRDEVIGWYLKSEGGSDGWREKARSIMSQSAFPAEWVPEMCDAIERNHPTLAQFAFLYGVR